MRKFCWSLLLLPLLVGFAHAGADTQTVTTTKIVNNGPDGQKLVFAVVGDGYSAAGQAKFAADVNNLVVNGVLALIRQSSRTDNV